MRVVGVMGDEVGVKGGDGVEGWQMLFGLGVGVEMELVGCVKGFVEVWDSCGFEVGVESDVR